MNVIIQCAGTKQETAPSFGLKDGRKVVFVAHPELAPATKSILWAHPDAPSDAPQLTWRQRLERENRNRTNSYGLLKAFQLYTPPAYRALARCFGESSVYILSAGWGLVRADFLLPSYDITFSPRAEDYKRRRPADAFTDLNQIPRAASGPLVFIGGKDYLPLFRALSANTHAEKIVFFRSEPGRKQPGYREGSFTFKPFQTPAKTNWHYGLAELLCRNPELIRNA